MPLQVYYHSYFLCLENSQLKYLWALLEISSEIEEEEEKGEEISLLSFPYSLLPCSQVCQPRIVSEPNLGSLQDHIPDQA